jgi:hypothetical protein
MWDSLIDWVMVVIDQAPVYRTDMSSYIYRPTLTCCEDSYLTPAASDVVADWDWRDWV